MKEDCRNDCLAPLRFPIVPDNRPGLSHLKYRIGTYADIREALLRNLDKTPGLAQWTHRGADDPGIALLEGAAILGDILTFYQELYANEAYLRTAQWRESIADLVRLLGYRLSPGLGGHSTFECDYGQTAEVLSISGRALFLGGIHWRRLENPIPTYWRALTLFPSISSTRSSVTTLSEQFRQASFLSRNLCFIKSSLSKRNFSPCQISLSD